MRFMTLLVALYPGSQAGWAQGYFASCYFSSSQTICAEKVAVPATLRSLLAYRFR